ncbi:Hypothetical predicted protein, partial [Paramuricea clavata]
QNHLPSAKSKATGILGYPTPTISVGDLVYLTRDKDKLKAREKYLVIDIDPSKMCHLRKFTSSQFRSKVYLVPMADCYPLKPSVVAQPSQGPVRGQDERLESDSDNEYNTSTEAEEHTRSVTPPIIVPPSPPVADAISGISAPPTPTTTEAVVACKHSSSVVPPRKSVRERRPPYWCTQDWDLNRY